MVLVKIFKKNLTFDDIDYLMGKEEQKHIKIILNIRKKMSS